MKSGRLRSLFRHPISRLPSHLVAQLSLCRYSGETRKKETEGNGAYLTEMVWGSSKDYSAASRTLNLIKP